MQPHSAHLPTSQARAASDSANISRGTSSQLQQEDNQQPLSFRVQQQAHTGSERIYYEAGRPAGEKLKCDGCCNQAHTNLRETKNQAPKTQGNKGPDQGKPATIQARSNGICKNLWHLKLGS